MVVRMVMKQLFFIFIRIPWHCVLAFASYLIPRKDDREAKGGGTTEKRRVLL
jgi:hypothetical protein